MMYKSDGTSGGTTPIASIGNYAQPEFFTDVNGVLFFLNYSDAHGRELWKSDGTAAGTGIVKDINPGKVYSNPQQFTAAGNRLFFSAQTPEYGRELWVSDGTTTGTKLVKDIEPGDKGSVIGSMVGHNGTLYFAGHNNSLPQYPIWKSDGTEQGTMPINNKVNDVHVRADFLYSNGYDIFYRGDTWFLATMGLYKLGDLAASIPRNYESALKVFPVPSSDEIRITSDDIITKVEIIDINGACIHRGQNITTINVRELKNGIYSALITTQQGKTETRRFIVSH